MTSEGQDGALTSTHVEDETKPRNSTSGCDDLFNHAHQTLLKGTTPRQEEGKGGGDANQERGVKERKRKRRKEGIRHIQRVQASLDVPVAPSQPVPAPLASPTHRDAKEHKGTQWKNEDQVLHPQPSTGAKNTPSRPPSTVPPLIPLTLTPFLHLSAKPATPPPPPRPATPPQTRSLPSSPTPSLMHSPSPPTSASPPTTTKETEKKRKKVCAVCGDVARSLHFGGRVCDSCKAFFRRAVRDKSFLGFACVRRGQGGVGGGGGGGGGEEDEMCIVNVRNRRECQFCRFSACLRAGMEVSLVTREDKGSQGLSPSIGLYRYLSRHAHAHAKALHGAPYLAGCWRVPYTTPQPALTPYLMEESRFSPTGGEAAPSAASGPVPLLHQDPALRHPAERISTAPEVSRGLSHDLTSTHTHTHDNSRRSHGHSHDHVPRHVPRHRPPPAHPLHAPSGTTRPSKWPRSPSSWPDGVLSTPWRLDRSGLELGGGGGGGGGGCVDGGGDRQDTLTPQDLSEIQQLQESYIGKLKEEACLEEQVPRSELGRLYTCFIERRAKFLASTPLYGTVAAADRPRLLHVAVAMSTYLTGAHHLDPADPSWRQRRGAGRGGREVAVLSAASVRQLLSHQQFLHVMRFYNKYSTALQDPITAVLMQVLSLFQPEEGLQAPRPVEQARLHYLALLSRHLVHTHGPREGARRLATLLTAQQEARQLVELLRQVDLTPREPGVGLATSMAMLADRLQLVCRAAQGSKGSGDGGVPSTTPPPGHSPEALSGTLRLEHTAHTVSRLAQCQDPDTLAQARRILPPPLLHRFLHLLLVHAPHHPTPQCTPPSPSPSPPSPSQQPHELSITHHTGEPPPTTDVPRGLHHSHGVELAAE